MVTSKTYTFSNVTSNHTISAEFEPITFSVIIGTNVATSYGQVRYKINSGSWNTISDPTVATTVTVNINDNITVEAIDPTTGYRFKQWDIIDVESHISDMSTDNPYTESGITTNLIINVEFELIPFTITATAGNNGTITPSGSVSVNYGGNQQFTIQADSGYQIRQILVDGTPINLE